MNAREIIDLAQKGYEIPFLLFESLPAIKVSTPIELVDLIDEFHTNNSPEQNPCFVDRELLKKISLQFHSNAGTLTDDVKENLNSFASGSPVLRVAHTADHFAYFAFFTQFIFLDLVASSWNSQTEISPCQVFLVIDCDVIDDKRLRTSYFPDVDRNHGALRLATPVSQNSFGKIQKAISKPSLKTIEEWISLLEREIQHNLTVLYRGGIPHKDIGQVYERLNVINREIREAYHRSNNLAEFNAIFMSRVVNLHWKIPIAFFPLTNVAPLMKSCYEYLLTQYPTLVEVSSQVVDFLQSQGISIKNNLRLGINDFPFWYICPKCSTRLPVKCLSRHRLEIEAVCTRCSSRYRFNIGTFSVPNLDLVYDKIIPKVLYDELTDIIGWRMFGGVSYEGSAEHIITNSLIAQRIEYAVPPECLWRPRGVHYGLAEARAAQSLDKDNPTLSERTKQALKRAFFGRSSILYFIISQGLSGIFAMWRKHFELGGKVYTVNFGENPFLLSRKQEVLLRQEMCKLDKPSLDV